MSERPEDSLRRLFDEIAPPTDADTLVDRVDSHPRVRRPAWRYLLIGAAAASLVVGVVTVWVQTEAGKPLTLQTTTSTMVPSATTTTLDPAVVDRIAILDVALTLHLLEVDRVNTAWEQRSTGFAEARARLVDVATSLSSEADRVASDEILLEGTGLDHSRLVDAMNRAVSAAETVVSGLDAPDDGTLRRDAVARLTEVVEEIRRILRPFLPVLPEYDPAAVGSSYPDASWVLSSDGVALGAVTFEPADLTGSIAPLVVNAVRDVVLNDPRYVGATFLERKLALFGCATDDTRCPKGGGGLKIYTTVDFALQEEAVALLQDWLPPDLGLPAGAIAMVNNHSGAVVVMASGLDYGIDFATGQRPYDLATKGRRSPGSAFTPFALIAALEQGITLDSMWDGTTPQALDFGGPGPWLCTNADDNAPGFQSLEEALYRSTNTVFCQVALAVGAENIVDVAHRLGIRSPLPMVPSVGIGAAHISPLEMASAYSTIANQGALVESYLIERIEDSAGNVIYQHEVERSQVIEPALAAAVINTMQKVISEGTGGNASIGRPQFGKTGSIIPTYSDAWFVGAVPQFTTAVWVGFADDQRPMVDLTVRGTFLPRMFGSSVPAPIWREFMNIVLADVPVEDFPPDPEDTAEYYGSP